MMIVLQIVTVLATLGLSASQKSAVSAYKSPPKQRLKTRPPKTKSSLKEFSRKRPKTTLRR